MFKTCLAAILFCLHLVSGQDTCTCTPFYLCSNGTVITNGVGIIDIRAKPEDCANYLETCCQLKDVILAAKTPHVSLKIPECGYANPDGVGFRITGDKDNEAQFGELPWMVAIYHKEKNDQEYTFKCGGSLIHPQVVLTAAHCVSDGGTIKIRAGEWDTKTTNEILKHQDRDVSSVVIHPMFTRTNLQNDIGLLFLQDLVILDQHINVACLPPPSTIASGSKCLVSGWGQNSFEQETAYQAILKRIEVPIVPRMQCQSDFRRTRLGTFFRLHGSFVCAGGEGEMDSCTGDGGGPLVCPIEGENRYQQVGIVSWGIGCGSKGVPGAYVNVAYFRNWIDQQVKNKNLQISGYQY